MGEEEKKSEEAKKVEEEKKGEAKGGGNEKKAAGVAAEESKDSPPPADGAAAAPPPPPQEIILKVYMHCEGCARKVRRCLKGFEGVEEVETDCKVSKVVVKGDKADPLKVLERVQRKSHRQVELISPIPKPPPPEGELKKVEVKEVAKPEEKKEEPQVIIVLLKVHMHCEACAQEIKRRIQKMKGVESAEADLKSSEVTVKGVFEPSNLVDFIYKRTSKHAVIVKVEPVKKEEEKPKEGKEEKKADGGGDGEKDAKKGEDDGKKPKNDDGVAPPAQGGGGGGEHQAPEQGGGQEEGDPKLEMKRNEFYHYYPQNHNQFYHQGYVQESYGYPAYPPQIFSDENPNACSVM
ncbi:hypothetical protein ACH5RR_025281 [Cinchona calisaya]|uniref:HMA domain-containing protein n=1 Tax=Cinchona calisaya TaxID=153742 RepID=A0ABD2YZ67_9GENT